MKSSWANKGDWQDCDLLWLRREDYDERHAHDTLFDGFFHEGLDHCGVDGATHLTLQQQKILDRSVVSRSECTKLNEHYSFLRKCSSLSSYEPATSFGIGPDIDYREIP